jgi:hypothetical protein
VPVKLEKGAQRETQGKHISPKELPVPTFGGNFLYSEAESARNSK